MPYLIISLLLLAGIIVLHLWWRKRFALHQESAEWLRRERDQLQHERDEIRKEAGSQQNALFDSMVEGVLLLDENRRILHANQAIRSLFSLTPGQVEGKTIMESLRLHELEAMLHFLEHKSRIMGTEVNVPGEEDRQLEVNAVSIKDAEASTGASSWSSTILPVSASSRTRAVSSSPTPATSFARRSP